MYTSRVYENATTVGPYAVGFQYLAKQYILASLIDPTGVRPPEQVTYTWAGTPDENHPFGTTIVLNEVPDGRQLLISKSISMTLLDVLWTKSAALTKTTLARMSMDLLEKIQLVADEQTDLSAQIVSALEIIETVDLDVLESIAQTATEAAIQAQAAANAAEAAAASLTFPIDIEHGGTGATTASDARTALGLGTAATQATGTTENTIPVLGTGGRIAESMLPVQPTRLVQQNNYAISQNQAYSGTIPQDDTIPQITEGSSIWTATIEVAEGVTSIEFDANIYMSGSASLNLSCALFVDGGPNAVSAAYVASFTVSAMVLVRLRHVMTLAPGTHTVSLRAGAPSGTVYLNGVAASRIFGGIMASNIQVNHYKG